MKLLTTILTICLCAVFAHAVTNSADLAVDIRSNSSVVTNGQSVTYYVDAINNGPEQIHSDDACEVQFLPPNGQYNLATVSSSATQGTVNDDDWIIVWIPGTINSGQTLTMTVTVTINTTETNLNYATTGTDAYYNNSGTLDPNNSNNSDTLPQGFELVTDLLIWINDEGMDHARNIDDGPYTLEVIVSNAGPSVAHNSIVTNMLPEGSTFVVDWSRGTNTLNGRILTWEPGDDGSLWPNNTANLLVSITPTNTGVKTLTSTIYDSTDISTGNNQDTHDMTVTNTPPPPVYVTLGIEGWDIVPTINRYGTIEYYIHIYNDGAEDAVNTVVSNSLPPNTILESYIPSQGTLSTNDGQHLTWNVGTMTSSSNADITLFVRPLESGIITNTAEVFSDADINETTNTINVETTNINPGPPICTVMPEISTNATLGMAFFIVQIQTNNVVASNILVSAEVTRGPHVGGSTNVLTMYNPMVSNTVAILELEDEIGIPGLDRISITGNAGIIPFSVPVQATWDFMTKQEYTADTEHQISNGLNRYTIDIDDSFDIHKVSVELLMQHSWPENLELRLISPEDSNAELWSENEAMGSTNDNHPDWWVGVSNQYCVIDDDAGTNINASIEPFAGEYTTANLTMNVFTGGFSEGTWTLEIEDLFPEDYEGGTLYDWKIVLVPDDGDVDDDGMNDDWEIANGLDPNDPSDANADDDGDGASNWTEYRTGSNPDQAGDAFAFSGGYSLPNRSNEISIIWRSNSNAYYTIEEATDLMDGFTPIITNIFATPPTNTVVITNAAYNTPFFYKVIQEE